MFFEHNCKNRSHSILTLYQTIGTFARLILETDIYSYTLVRTFLIVKNFNVELFYSPYIHNTAILNIAVRTFVLLSFFIRPSVLSAPPVRCRMHNDRTVSPFSSLLLPAHKLKQIMGYKSSGQKRTVEKEEDVCIMTARRTTRSNRAEKARRFACTGFLTCVRLMATPKQPDVRLITREIKTTAENCVRNISVCVSRHLKLYFFFVKTLCEHLFYLYSKEYIYKTQNTYIFTKLFLRRL